MTPTCTRAWNTGTGQRLRVRSEFELFDGSNFAHTPCSSTSRQLGSSKGHDEATREK